MVNAVKPEVLSASTVPWWASTTGWLASAFGSSQ